MKIRPVSWERRFRYKNQVIEFMNSWIRYNWGKFNSTDFHTKLEETKKSCQENITKDLKHNKIPYDVHQYINGYFDAIRHRIHEDETIFAYKIFGKFYCCFVREEKFGFQKYDKVFPREVWTHPDFTCLGHRIWKDTFNDYYFYEYNKFPKYPSMTFWEKDGAVLFKIAQDENSHKTIGAIITGSFPFHFGKYEEIMKIAKNYNVSILNMEEI